MQDRRWRRGPYTLIYNLCISALGSSPFERWSEFAGLTGTVQRMHKTNAHAGKTQTTSRYWDHRDSECVSTFSGPLANGEAREGVYQIKSIAGNTDMKHIGAAPER